MEKLKMQTADMAERNIEILGQMFPNCLTEVKNDEGKIVRAIDFDKLRQELACEVVEGAEERYQFTWPDKRAAIRLANAPTNKTLRPCREESVDFDNTKNIYIEGDNLEVLKLLRENYLGKVKMIYIDPPYNTGNDFVYNDDFAKSKAEFEAQSGLFDEEGNRMADPMVQNTESNGRFHTDWLNMIYPRLKVAKDLLSDDGVIFISIDDNEIRNMQNICDEVFGQEMQIACFPRITKKAGKTTDAIAKNHDYIIAYSKTKTPLFYLPYHTDDGFKYEDEYVTERGRYKLNQTLDYDSLSYSASLDYPINIDGQTLYPGTSYEAYLERQSGNHARADWAWRWSKELFDYGYANGFIVLKKTTNGYRIYTKTYQNAKIEKVGNNFNVVIFDRTKAISSLEFVENEYSNDNSKKNILKLFGRSIFDYSKPISLIQKLVQYTSVDDNIILDFFSGSATTAHAVMKLNAEDGGNRKFIMVQLPEKTDEKSEAYKAGYKNICEIGKERIRRAGKKIREELIVKRDNIKTELYNITGGAAFDSNPSSMSYFMTKADETKKNKATQLNKELIDLDSKIESFDIGFRVLKLDTSNMKDVYYTPAETPIQQTLGFEELVDNIKWDERTPEDLIFQVLPECNLPLSNKIETREIHGKKVFVVEDGYLMACFDKDINESVITAIAKEKPYYFVMCDRSIATDNVADNFDQIFEAYSRETVRRIL